MQLWNQTYQKIVVARLVKVFEIFVSVLSWEDSSEMRSLSKFVFHSDQKPDVIWEKKMLKIRMIFHRNTHMTKLIRPKFGEHDQKIDDEN